MTEEDTFRALKRRPYADVLSFLLSTDNRGGPEATASALRELGWTIDEAHKEANKLAADGTLQKYIQKK